jgi:hypothetical protein
MRKHGSDGPAQIGRRLIDWFGSLAGGIRRVVARHAQRQEDDRQGESDEWGRVQNSLAYGHLTPKGAPTSLVPARRRPDAKPVEKGALLTI